MKKIIFIVLVGVVAVSLLAAPVMAVEDGEEAGEEESQAELIAQLQEQIELLKAQIEAVRTKIQELIEAGVSPKQIKEELRLSRQLWWGVRDEEVELLQEFLATDPEVYPEGLVTGYYGPLTYAAVKRFQKMAGIQQVGRVGPETMGKINDLLEYGAGKSGQVPPGLLIAPGIRKRLGAPELTEEEIAALPPGIRKKFDEGWFLPGEEEEEEEEEDTTAPVISEVEASDVETDSALISWMTDEEADSMVYYDTASPVDPSSAETESSSDMVEEHEIELTDLTADTEYHFFVTSADEFGNNATSTEDSFTTASETE